MVASTDKCMNRFRSTRLSRRNTSKTSLLCFVFNFIPFIISLFLCYTLVCHFHSSVIWLDASAFFFVFCRIKAWVDKMQEDLVTLARTASGVDRLAEVRRGVLGCCKGLASSRLYNHFIPTCKNAFGGLNSAVLSERKRKNIHPAIHSQCCSSSSLIIFNQLCSIRHEVCHCCNTSTEASTFMFCLSNMVSRKQPFTVVENSALY